MLKKCLSQISPFHTFHLVEARPWPLIGSLRVGLITSGSVLFFYQGNTTVIALGLIATILVAGQWWRDISREASFQGYHTLVVEWNIRWGMALFITSEIMFFFSFFWAYFHRSLAPCLEIGLVWPPVGVQGFNPFSVPLLNTTILLCSGLTVTWAHHSILSGDHYEAIVRLAVTIILGVYFTFIQAYEYIEAYFTFADSVYGSCFFIATGFHGIHVLVGTTYLLVCLYRLTRGQLSVNHHFGFEAAAWYWHFVDVVWIFLFVRVYWWGA